MEFYYTPVTKERRHKTGLGVNKCTKFPTWQLAIPHKWGIPHMLRTYGLEDESWSTDQIDLGRQVWHRSWEFAVFPQVVYICLPIYVWTSSFLSEPVFSFCWCILCCVKGFQCTHSVSRWCYFLYIFHGFESLIRCNKNLFVFEVVGWLSYGSWRDVCPQIQRQRRINLHT